VTIHQSLQYAVDGLAEPELDAGLSLQLVDVVQLEG
jgi:hypothetical protein